MNRGQLRQWIKKRWMRLLFVVFIGLPVLSFLLASTMLLSYTYWPAKYSKITTPQIDPMAQHIFLIAHGLGDTTLSWTDPLKATLDAQNASRSDSTQVIALDWSAYSNAPFRCSTNGRRIGHILGKTLAESATLESVHLIGHSCGAFVVLGLCESLKEIRHDIQVQSTYLDPVSIYGAVFWNYGINHFGGCADFSEVYIDTEDGVAGSNQLIPNTHTFDVTNARKGTGFSQQPHVWPTRYYQLLVESGGHPSLRTHRDLWPFYPRGEIEQIDELPDDHQLKRKQLR